MASVQRIQDNGYINTEIQIQTIFLTGKILLSNWIHLKSTHHTTYATFYNRVKPKLLLYRIYVQIALLEKHLCLLFGGDSFIYIFCHRSPETKAEQWRGLSSVAIFGRPVSPAVEAVHGRVRRQARGALAG